MFVIIFSGMTSALGLYFLSKAAARTEGRDASFFAVSQITWPSAGVFFDLAIAIKCFGVGISYMLIVGDLMPQVRFRYAKWAKTPFLLMVCAADRKDNT